MNSKGYSERHRVYHARAYIPHCRAAYGQGLTAGFKKKRE